MSLLLRWLFSSYSEWGPLSSFRVQAFHCGGFSCCRVWVLGHSGFISYGSRALEHRLSNCGARVYLLPCVWDLPRSGIKLCLPHWLLLLSRLSHVQLCATLWTTVCQAPLSRDSPGKNTWVGCHAFLQEIFPTQGSNPGLFQADSLPLSHQDWQADSLPVSHQGSPSFLLNVNTFDPSY